MTSLAVHLYVHGRGRGHASRAIPLVAALGARGHHVRVFAGGDAVDVLRPYADTTAVRSLPPQLGFDALATLRRRLATDVAQTRAVRPDVVVSDGDLPGLCAARLCGVPTIALGHGLVFLSCRRPRGVPRLPWWREAAKAGVASLGARRRIATHFAVLPVRRRDTTLARPPVRPWSRTTPPDRIVAYFRDGIDDAQLAALRHVDPEAVVFAPNARPGVLAPSPAFDDAVARARAVVATAGSSLIAECVAHGVPLLALYRDDDDEQRLNATMLAHAGLGLAAPLHSLSSAHVAALVSRSGSTSSAVLPATDAIAAVVDACESLGSHA